MQKQFCFQGNSNKSTEENQKTRLRGERRKHTKRGKRKGTKPETGEQVDHGERIQGGQKGPKGVSFGIRGSQKMMRRPGKEYG